MKNVLTYLILIMLMYSVPTWGYEITSSFELHSMRPVKISENLEFAYVIDEVDSVITIYDLKTKESRQVGLPTYLHYKRKRRLQGKEVGENLISKSGRFIVLEQKHIYKEKQLIFVYDQDNSSWVFYTFPDTRKLQRSIIGPYLYVVGSYGKFHLVDLEKKKSYQMNKFGGIADGGENNLSGGSNFVFEFNDNSAFYLQYTEQPGYATQYFLTEFSPNNHKKIQKKKVVDKEFVVSMRQKYHDQMVLSDKQVIINRNYKSNLYDLKNFKRTATLPNSKLFGALLGVDPNLQRIYFGSASKNPVSGNSVVVSFWDILNNRKDVYAKKSGNLIVLKYAPKQNVFFFKCFGRHGAKTLYWGKDLQQGDTITCP